MCAAYVADGDGELRPVLGIDRCPYGASGDGPCRLVVHQRRARKTGPAVPLTQLRCRTHGGCFTVYPLGFTPFARQRIAPAGHQRTGESTASRDRWAGTVFEAAAEAAAGELGVRDAGYDGGQSRPRHSSVRRRIAVAARLLGLAAELDDRQAEQVAQALEIPGLDHARARRAARAPGLRERGAAIVSVLDRMPLSGPVERRLLCAGAQVRLWGRPGIWDVATGRLVFPPCGTTGGKSPLIRPIAPNKFVPPSAHGPPRTVPSS